MPIEISPYKHLGERKGARERWAYGIHPDDAKATLRGLTPGYYSSKDIYRRYVSVAEEARREPGSHRSLSITIKKMGAQSRSISGTRMWVIDQGVLAGLDE